MDTNEGATKGLSKVKCWVEAMRLRTLPVSVAGVVTAVAIALMNGTFQWLQSLICLAFALLAQIASNFANEYFDFRASLDRKGRVGPRRGVTEGDITPRAMLAAALGTLGVAAALGLTLICWGGWWLLAVGIVIVIGTLAYSTGPYPLSRHALGEVAVVFFFGIAPVTLTYYVQAGDCPWQVWLAALSMGMMGANVLIVNNYRDADDDRAVGKTTLAVKFGRKFAGRLYLVNGLVATAAMMPVWFEIPVGVGGIMLQGIGVWILWQQMCRAEGAALNPLLGKTARLMLIVAVCLLICGIWVSLWPESASFITE